MDAVALHCTALHPTASYCILLHPTALILYPHILLYPYAYTTIPHQGNITSATDNLVKTSDAILFPPTPATNAPPAPNAEAKEGESKEGDLEKKGDNKAADMDLVKSE